MLPSEGDGFTAAIVGRILAVDAVACMVLLALHAVAASIEFVPAATRSASP